MGEAKNRKKNGALPRPSRASVKLTLDAGAENPLRVAVASHAALTLLTGFREGKAPIKVSWLSLESDEPIGMVIVGQPYIGILIRYEEGTNGRRYCGGASGMQEANMEQDGVMVYGDIPFALPTTIKDEDGNALFAILTQLLAVKKSDVLITVVNPE